MGAARKEEIRRALGHARERTLWLLERVPDAFLKVRVHDFYSPIGWHFGHIGRTEEYWVHTRALDRPPLDPALTFLFADLPENPKDNRVHLPSRDEIKRYLAQTRRRTLQALAEADLSSADPLLAGGYGWEFAHQHECQHQETITEMLQLIQKYSRPHPPNPPLPKLGEGGERTCPGLRLPSPRGGKGPHRVEEGAGGEGEMLPLPGGVFTMGSDDPHGYDNEKNAHPAQVASFELDRTPVTAAQWLRFMEDGGYARPALWTEEGWAWRQREGAERPEYWQAMDTDGGYGYFGPQGPRAIHPDEPVSSISRYEADAYARWAGKRLPTEAEWEYAARFDTRTGESRRYPWGEAPPTLERASFGLHAWAPAPVGSKPGGASAWGLLDMAGGVWEWTATPFLPYPGFRAYPYDGYSKDHMGGGHFVCRGGSWATAEPILRCSFRNWYVPTYRQGFLGLRCAR